MLLFEPIEPASGLTEDVGAVQHHRGRTERVEPSPYRVRFYFAAMTAGTVIERRSAKPGWVIDTPGNRQHCPVSFGMTVFSRHPPVWLIHTAAALS